MQARGAGATGQTISYDGGMNVRGEPVD